MRIFKRIALLVCCVNLVTGCATSQKVQTVQLNDQELNKDEIMVELKRLDDIQKDIDSKKGVTGTNVAAVLFFWPGLAYTYYDAAEAERLVQQRRSHLTALYNQKIANEKGGASASAGIKS